MNANDLIERLERETGQRIDSNDGENNAMFGLLGAVSRLMGKSPSNYQEKDDVAAGILIRHQLSPEYQDEQEQNEMVANMLMAGISPEDVKKLVG